MLDLLEATRNIAETESIIILIPTEDTTCVTAAREAVPQTRDPKHAGLSSWLAKYIPPNINGKSIASGGFTAAQLRNMGVNAILLHYAGVSGADLENGGINPLHLLQDITTTPQELLSFGFINSDTYNELCELWGCPSKTEHGT